MKQFPLLSVIIPVYNGELYLADAIKSIINQQYQPLEIIVIDDGSTDNSAEVVKSFKQNVDYYFQDHSGLPAALNHGLKLAKGNFIAFLDADDIWL